VGPRAGLDAEKRKIFPCRVIDAVKGVFDMICLISKMVNPIFHFVGICVTIIPHKYYKINVLRMPWSEPQIVN
jgi:hypothetical protein